MAYVPASDLSDKMESLIDDWQESIAYCCRFLIQNNPEIKKIALAQGLNFVELYNGRQFDPEFSDDPRFNKLRLLLESWYTYFQYEPGIYETRKKGES